MMTAPRPAKKKKVKRKLALPRTTILFFVGLGLVVNEAVLRGIAEPRVELLITYLFMMGFPVAEIGDILRRRLLDDESESGDSDE